MGSSSPRVPPPWRSGRAWAAERTRGTAPGGERVVVSVSDTPGLATAGSGDVLTGVVAAMLAKGLDPWTAACCGAVMHQWAARRAAEAIGPDGIISGDVIEALPGVLTE